MMLFGCRESVVVDGNIHIAGGLVSMLLLVSEFLYRKPFLGALRLVSKVDHTSGFNFHGRGSYRGSLLWVSFLEVPPFCWFKRKPRRAPTICDPIVRHIGMGPMNTC